MRDGSRQVKRILASLRYPAIPAHLAGRIDAAIAAEAAIRTRGEPMSRDVVGRSTTLAAQAAKAKAEAKRLKEDVRKLAGLVGETEHAISDTMDRLASEHPHHAELLRELSQDAKRGVAQAKELAA